MTKRQKEGFILVQFFLYYFLTIHLLACFARTLVVFLFFRVIVLHFSLCAVCLCFSSLQPYVVTPLDVCLLVRVSCGFLPSSFPSLYCPSARSSFLSSGPCPSA